jgi:hypothetical protein
VPTSSHRPRRPRQAMCRSTVVRRADSIPITDSGKILPKIFPLSCRDQRAVGGQGVLRHDVDPHHDERRGTGQRDGGDAAQPQHGADHPRPAERQRPAPPRRPVALAGRRARGRSGLVDRADPDRAVRPVRAARWPRARRPTSSSSTSASATNRPSGTRSPSTCRAASCWGR